MMKRWFSGLTVLCVLAAAYPVRADDAKKEKPTLVVSVKSVDAVIANTKYLIKLAGKEELAKQYEAMLKARIGKKGLDGIDTKRPVGLYVTDLTNGAVVVMVPIADEKALLGLLKGFNLEPEKNAKGLYTVSPDFLPVEIYFRIVNKYAYITALNADNIDVDKLLDPEVIAPRNKTALASITAHIDRIPDAVKQIALSQMELQFKKLHKKPAHESEAEGKVRMQVLKDIAAAAAAVIKDGNELNIQLEVDRKANTLAVEASLSGKSGTQLSKNIADLGKATSLFAGIASEDDVITALIHVALPKDWRDLLAPVIDASLKKAQEREKDEAKRELAEKLIKSITPTLKAGEIDAFLSVRGPSAKGHFGGLLGLKVKDAAEVEKVVKDIITKIAPLTEKVKIKLDAEKEGDVAIHRVDYKGELDARAKKILGNAPLYFAFRQDALFVTVGEGGLDALKAAIGASPKAGPLVSIQISLARLATLIAAASDDEHGQKVAKILKDAFEDSKDAGRAQLTLEGGKALKARFSMSAHVVKAIFMAVTQIHSKEAQEKEKTDQQSTTDKDK